MSALAEARLDFKIAVTSLDQRCRAHDYPTDCEGAIQAHHVITQQHLRAAGLASELWNPNVGMTVCEKAHRRHHNRHQPIRRDHIPARCIQFVAEHGLERYFDRYYPED